MNRKKALVITKEAKNNTFIDCKVVGDVEIAGKGTRMVRTKFTEPSNNKENNKER